MSEQDMVRDSMVERVARGVYAKNGWWGIVQPGDDGKGRYDTKAGARMRAVEWEELEVDEIDSRLKDARAAIEALREPTEGMIAAGYDADSTEDDDEIIVANVWRAMIDKALGK